MSESMAVHRQQFRLEKSLGTLKRKEATKVLPKSVKTVLS